jgi:uncharacterized membrane protein
MAKHQQITKARGNSGGQQVERSVYVDDNLLPDAEEIQKLHAIDPNIMDWLKERAEKEQEFRHVTFGNRTQIIASNEKHNRTLNTLGLIFAFILMLSGMFYSAFLVHSGQSITGTIFSGATLLVGAALLITRKLNASPAPIDK